MTKSRKQLLNMIGYTMLVTPLILITLFGVGMVCYLLFTNKAIYGIIFVSVIAYLSLTIYLMEKK